MWASKLYSHGKLICFCRQKTYTQLSQIHILGTFLVYILHKALCLSMQIPLHIHVYMFNSESTRLRASMEFVASRRVCLRPDIWESSYGSWSWTHRGTYSHKGRCTCLQWWSLLCSPPNPPTNGPVGICAIRTTTITDTVPVSYRCVFSHDSPSSGFQLRPLTNC